MELAGSRAVTKDAALCNRLRSDSECPGMLCRLGCDYGFVIDEKTGCSLCECRDPCNGTKCPNGQACQMLATTCDDPPFCPALPYCADVKRTAVEPPQCPTGEAYVNPLTDQVLSCNPRSRALTCPDGFSCQSDEDSAEGVCCPVEHAVKAGQCPFLVPVSVDSCDNECASDEDCDGSLKCCSNGCGTQCVEPLMKTACQHMQLIMKYKARESGVPANRMFIPKCRADDGSYEPIQCDPVTRACWCVGRDGAEIQGTRAPPGMTPICNKPRSCPQLYCALDCPQGLRLDSSGCPVCACNDLCQGVDCASPNEECRMVQVNCIRKPCPSLPVCLPRLSNPCAYGQPLIGKLFELFIQFPKIFIKDCPDFPSGNQTKSLTTIILRQSN